MGKQRATPRTRLRYFGYAPPLGGFGGDWDTLEATSQPLDEAAWRRAVRLLGYTGPAIGAARIDLGILAVAGAAPRVALEAERGGGRALSFLGAVYVTDGDLERLRGLERWLDEQGVPMVAAPARST